MKYFKLVLGIVIGISGCIKEDAQPLFILKYADETGVTFANTLEEGPNTNVLMYEYFYNGGGVATADFNGDGWMDVYFTSNMGSNKLYLNKGQGGFIFEDVTAQSRTSGRLGPWKTGVSIVDINSDGKPDIYLCYSGAMPEEKRRNQLFINTTPSGSNEISFEESASKYGLDSPSFTTMAYFFDYDLDGDLDVILLNHNPKNLPNLNEEQTKELMSLDDSFKGSRLLNNENGFFKDVTKDAGINGSELSYGLGLGIGDFNQDGWPDFYLSNDYNVPDFLYMNNQDGTFSNTIHQSMTHISQFSMGNDVSDINRDGLLDIFTLDMLPEDNSRQKLLMAPDNYSKFDLNVRSGFHHQFMRNMLQVNNGNGTFSEIGQFAGISNTDWSWSALAEDYNNDGWPDLFITNGYTRDYTNLDFINYMDQFIQSKGRFLREDVLELIKAMPASDVRNYMFSGHKDLKFVDATNDWGFTQYSNSNGAVFADLDNDGDLDLVVNNVNKQAFIYENTLKKDSVNYLQIEFIGNSPNSSGIGTAIKIYARKEVFYKEHYLSRGFQSSVSPIMHFGLGQFNHIDSMEIMWPSGKMEMKYNLIPNQRIQIKESEATEIMRIKDFYSTIFVQGDFNLPFTDKAPSIRDFARQPLLHKEISVTGPVFKITDINNDGWNDMVLGGAKGMAAQLYLGNKNGEYTLKPIQAFEQDAEFHDTYLEVLDLNGDGLKDIYIASGGYHDLGREDDRLADRVYLQNQFGNFDQNKEAIPVKISTSVVAFEDVNQDGFPDIFLAGGAIPGRYPAKPFHYILMNNKKGGFEENQPVLPDFGIIADAHWHDLNNDGRNELLVVGEWTPLTIFEIKNGQLDDVTLNYFPEKLSGLWNKIELEDINGDGITDILLGNLGRNTQLHPPLQMYFGDFVGNGDIISIMTNTIQGSSYPYVSRDELLKQMVPLKKKFPDYLSFSKATISDLVLDSSQVLNADYLDNTLWVSQKGRPYKKASMPPQFQWSSIHQVAFLDYNQDGHKDFVAFGNDSNLKLSLGRNSANYGQLFKNNGNDVYEYISPQESGLIVQGDVRCVQWNRDELIIGSVGMPLQSFRLNKSLQ
jgi:enediyne biosynthesis protein E4